MQRKIECPYSKARLEEMYWKEGMSTYDIAAHCRSVTDSKTDSWTIRHWLKRFGIPTRTYSHAMRVVCKTKPEVIARVIASAAKGNRVSAENRRGKPSPNPNWQALMKKGRKAAAKKSAEEARETRICQYCGAEVTRNKSRFQHPPERTYCSLSCSNKGRWERTRKAKAEEAITRQIVALVGYDPREGKGE